MKTVFISIYDGDTEKNILQSRVFEILREEPIRIVLLVKHGLVEKYVQYAGERVVVEELPPASCFSERLFFWLGWNVIPTRSIFMRRYETYLNNHNWLQYRLGQLLGFLGKYRVFRHLLRLVYALIPDVYAVSIFKQYAPDLLFAPNMFSYEDGRLLRTAKRRKIKTITTSKSWDVLTNKAFTRVLADKILVQNDSIGQHAMDHGDYRPEQVEPVGFVQFDFVADPSILLSREQFFASIGADPERALILYSTSGDWKNPYDDEVVQGIHSAIEEGALIKPAQILARFHPKYPSKIEKLDLPYLIKDRPCTDKDNQEESLDGVTEQVYSFSFNRNDLIHLANSLFHSDVTINTMSTMTLDAIAFDKPVILIAHDGFDRELSYWQSLRRTYDEDHYRPIIDARCTKTARSMHATIESINTYLNNPAEDEEARAHIRNELLFKLDGRSGERIARAVLSHLHS